MLGSILQRVEMLSELQRAKGIDQTPCVERADSEVAQDVDFALFTIDRHDLNTAC
ncbi:hypothetical protein [Oricola thermophila]|uniref:Uncharacterized protein n=1 Tax=Oricola thermophila TaxID=2742145 RepID=A0A6N1VJU0_9HYPH|nr:hypothetical protein [Oricola thermophila]QKV20035.1 hypothetical protein HTY61_17050 [Oricola thermophila]